MLEPVEIDINMNQNVSEESDKATQGVNNMTSSVDVLEKEIARLEKVVKDMSVALAEQEKIIESSNADYSEATSRIETMREALVKAEKELDAYRQTAEQANEAVSQGADVTSVMNDVVEALAETEATLTESAETLIDNQSSINEALDEATESTETYSASNQILSEVIKRVADTLGIENTHIVRAVSNVHTITAVKKGWTVATKLLTLAQKALVATGLMAVVAGIVMLIKAYQDWRRGQQEAADRIEARNKELAERMEKQNKIIAESAATALSSYKKLQSEWNSLAGSLKDKEKFITSNKKEFEKLGIEVQNVADAENVLVNNTDAVVNSFMIKARAAAASELAADSYKKAMEKQLEAEKRAKSPTKQEFAHSPSVYEYRDIDGHKNVPVYMGTEASIEAAKEIQKEADELFKEADKLTNNQIDFLKQAEDELKKAGITATKQQPKTKSPKTSPEEKATTSLEKKTYEYQKRINDARVKAIHEGAERERAAAKADYEETKLYIEKELKELAELEKKTGKPATEQRRGLLEYDVAATQQYESELDRINARSKKDIDSIFAEVNARFASELDRNITEINAYYASLIAEAQKAGASIEEVQRLKDAQQADIDRAGINDQLRKTDLDEALDMERAANMEAVGLTTIAEQMKYEIAKHYLEQRIALLRKMGDESSNKEADILEERLKGLQNMKAPTSITRLVNGKLFSSIQKGLERTGMSAEDAQKKTTDLFAGMQKGGAIAANIIGEMQGMFGGLDEGLDGAMEAVGNIAQGFAQGGPLGAAMAAIGEGIKMFSKYKQVDKEHEKALRELALSKLELQRKYNLLLLQEMLLYKQGANIFGTDQIRGAVKAIEVYKKTIVELKDEIRGEMPTAPSFKDNPFNYEANLEKYRRQVEAYNKGIGALADVDIVTGSRKSGWGFWRKRKDVYEPLLKVYDDIIDKEGNLNTARIQSVLDTHKMSDENKALLQSLLDLSKAAEDAEQQLTDYLNQTFGSLGDALSDSIVTAFKNGEDAALLFKDSVTGVLEDLAKQMVFSLYLKDTFDRLDKDIRNAYDDLANDKLTEKQLSEKITNILGGFFGGLDEDVEKANKFLEEFWKNAEANGFDRTEGERQGATGGFANASQESITELTGGVYAVRQMVGDIRNDKREQLLIERTILTQLNVLVERSDYWFFLEHLETIKATLNSMETYGLKMKM